jgi:hypothetical protein
MEIAAIPLTISDELHALISTDHCSIWSVLPNASCITLQPRGSLLSGTGVVPDAIAYGSKSSDFSEARKSLENNNLWYVL